MFEPEIANIMEITIKKEIIENDEMMESINAMEMNMKKEIEDDEMNEETCYFCGYPVQLEPGQSTAQCGLCSETVTFEQPKDKITCPFCKNVTNEFLGVGPNRCEVCSEILNGQPFQDSHKLFMCDVCGKRLRSKYRLGKHLKKHMTPRLECKYCPQLFTRNAERRTHERCHQIRSKSYECDICEVTCFSQELLKQHKTIHAQEGVDRNDSPQNGSLCTSAGKIPYVCGLCGMAIQTKEYLRQHVDEHRKLFPNKCFSCGLICPEAKHLKKHVCNPSSENSDITSMPTVRGRRRLGQTGELSQKDILGTPKICRTPGDLENPASPLATCATRVNLSSTHTNKLTNRVKNEIKYQVKKGMSEKKVAKILNVSERVINNICWLKCHPELVKYATKLVLNDRFQTLSQLTDISRADPNARANVTQRVMDETGYSITGGVSGALDEDSRSQRLAWAKRHSTWTKEDWSKVLWTGTVKFRRFRTSPPYDKDISISSREHIWRLPSEDPSEKVIQSPTTGKESLHMWGCMSSGGFGELRRIIGSFDATWYLKILKENMFPCAFSLIGPDFILQHENNSEQAQDLQVQMWLSSPARDLVIMEWPTVCSDLNPLETVWNRLCPDLDGFDSDDLDELLKKIECLIREIPTSFFMNVIDTMKNRCAALVQGRGGYINCR